MLGHSFIYSDDIGWRNTKVILFRTNHDQSVSIYVTFSIFVLYNVSECMHENFENLYYIGIHTASVFKL